MSNAPSIVAGLDKQWVRIGLVFGSLSVALVAAYALLLREDYVVLYDNLRDEDAAAIVTEMDEQNIRYRLRDNGRQILVPESRTGEARLAIAGSEAGRGGLTGFELFDDSDMGLTDFAQGVKYQRALQGELARTILMMDGVDQVRVHIVMPERTLFRGETGAASAAVTLLLENGVEFGPERVIGVQRLVAASVSGLADEDVVVLNATGAILSVRPTYTPENDATRIDTAAAHSEAETIHDESSEAATELVELPHAPTSAGSMVADLALLPADNPTVTQPADESRTQSAEQAPSQSDQPADDTWMIGVMGLIVALLFVLGGIYYRRNWAPSLTREERMEFADRLRRSLDGSDLGRIENAE